MDATMPNQIVVLDDEVFSLDTLERIEAELAAVDRAIERIDAGTFGQCEVCATTIRAEAMATDPLTARCDAHPDQLRALDLTPR